MGRGVKIKRIVSEWSEIMSANKIGYGPRKRPRPWESPEANSEAMQLRQAANLLGYDVMYVRQLAKSGKLLWDSLVVRPRLLQTESVRRLWELRVRQHGLEDEQ